VDQEGSIRLRVKPADHRRGDPGTKKQRAGKTSVRNYPRTIDRRVVEEERRWVKIFSKSPKGSDHRGVEQAVPRKNWRKKDKESAS